MAPIKSTNSDKTSLVEVEEPTTSYINELATVFFWLTVGSFVIGGALSPALHGAAVGIPAQISQLEDLGALFSQATAIAGTLLIGLAMMMQILIQLRSWKLWFAAPLAMTSQALLLIALRHSLTESLLVVLATTAALSICICTLLLRGKSRVLLSLAGFGFLFDLLRFYEWSGTIQLRFSQIPNGISDALRISSALFLLAWLLFKLLKKQQVLFGISILAISLLALAPSAAREGTAFFVVLCGRAVESLASPAFSQGPALWTFAGLLFFLVAQPLFNLSLEEKLCLSCTIAIASQTTPLTVGVALASAWALLFSAENSPPLLGQPSRKQDAADWQRITSSPKPHPQKP
ncbi:MAG: hypothetical protein MK135_05970 [Polyangiaceae bacterium]|nr:hypothetical protein [Polyangiaceae bacterium]